MCGINTGAQGSPCAKELWTSQQAGQKHEGDKQKILTITLRFGGVFDMAALTAPANHYKLGSVITFRS